MGGVDEGRKLQLRRKLVQAATELRQLGESEDALIFLIKEADAK